MRWTDDDTHSIKMLIKNKGICFGTQDKIINCNLCVIYNQCDNGIENNDEIVGDLYYQRYLIAVAIAKDYFTESELFELLL